MTVLMQPDSVEFLTETEDVDWLDAPGALMGGRVSISLRRSDPAGWWRSDHFGIHGPYDSARAAKYPRRPYAGRPA